MNYLTKKIAFISGSTSGLGKELSINLAKNGYHILIHGRDLKKLNYLYDEIISLKGTSTIINLDLTDFDTCFETIIDQKPDWIINAGAYTNVDGAELNKELAIETNANSILAFSKALKITGGKLLQLSTDFVFDGNQKFPYANDQIKNPINYYGYTKALAEENIIKTFGSQKQYLILNHLVKARRKLYHQQYMAGNN